MKTLIAASLLTMAAGAAQAEIKVETRAFHSNLGWSGESGYSYIDGVPESGNVQIKSGYFNAPGAGLAVLFHTDETLEVGLGYDAVRYYPRPNTSVEQQTFDAFTRVQLLEPSAFRIYFLAGVSNHELSAKDTDARFTNRVTPILNYDFGFGTTYRLGNVDLGLEYKFSNTLATGTGTSISKERSFAANGDLNETEVKIKSEGIKAETHRAAFTFGVKL